MHKDFEGVIEENGMMNVYFKLPEEYMPDCVLVLMDLGWVCHPNQVSVSRDDESVIEAFWGTEEAFWWEYNDPDRPRFTKEMLREVMNNSSNQ